MICSANVLFDVKKAAKFHGKFGREAWVSVRDDLLGGAVVWDKVLEEQLRDSFRVDCLLTRDKNRGFGAVRVCDSEDGVISA